MRKSNNVFSDPANGGILNLNQLQSKPSGSSLNIESLLLSTLCCMNSNDKPLDKPYTLSPAPAPPASKPWGEIQKEDSFNEFKKFV